MRKFRFMKASIDHYQSTIIALSLNMNFVRNIVVLVCFVLAPLCWAERQASIPLPKALAETLVGGFFPQSIAIEQGSLLLKDPHLLFLDDDRLGLRTNLCSRTRDADEEGEAVVQGAALVSSQIAYE